MKITVKYFFFPLLLIIGASLAVADNVKEGNRLYDAGKYQEALTYFMKPDAQNDPETINLIGYMYQKGQGVKENHQKAFFWYQKAAEAGLAVAQFNVGLMYQYGKGVSKDMAKAVEWFKKAAEQNDTNAQMKMGYLTVKGIGTEKNYKEAMRWFRRAAENGDKGAFVDIGIMYSKGDGVKKDLNHAVQYYILGAHNGDAAQALLGNAYSDGKGIEQDTDKAMYWYKQAAKNGSIEAMKELGYIYESGRLGVKKDQKEAQRWKDMAEKASQEK
ncbi:tetratricopeptide repeat protein [Oxalobacter formigenes]|uniref:tetratricopeptide repeat protein n=1 Tax=Oxalobacter formigenes TaxID=847 RepID=UPI00241E3B1C|nr:tetratricopeptide repeat protein [Oxalobacter formigenes]